jgi:NADPH:quinone reductase-like Zn-dependent oxidoreductase
MASTQIPETMKAWQYSSTTGGIEKNLVLNDSVAIPTISSRLGDTELLIQVVSASINPADYKAPELGLVARAVIRTPATPGMDFSGRVVQTTPTVDDFAIGDLVFGRIDVQQHGTTAEYIVAPTKACAPVPEGVSLDDAATVGVAGITAYRRFPSRHLIIVNSWRAEEEYRELTVKQRPLPPTSSPVTRSLSTAAQAAPALLAFRSPKLSAVMSP